MTVAFFCSICEEESSSICVRCTKDTCANHLCVRCGSCSDCCDCEVPLEEPLHEAPPVHAADSPPHPEPEPEPPHPPPDPDPVPVEEPESSNPGMTG